MYVAVGVGLLAIAAVGGFVLSLDDEERVRLTERADVIRSAQEAAKRFRVLITDERPRVFAAAGRRSKTSPPNPFRLPPTPDDPAAESVRSDDFPEVGGQAPPGTQDEVSNRLSILRETVVDGVRSRTSHIAEPHLATDGERVLVVWNWGAARSLDGGETFENLDLEPSPLPFCCDQLVYYTAAHDVWIWLLQYRGPGGAPKKNTIRLAHVSGAAFANRPRPAFATFDLQARDIAGSRQGVAVDGDAYLDFSRIAATQDHLFVTVNMFATSEGAYSGSVVIRIPFSELVAGAPRAEWYLAGPRSTGLTSGASDTMYFASHRTTSLLSVCRWDDDAANPSCGAVRHSAHPDPRTGPYLCQRQGAPAASDWCQRLTDGRPKQDDRPLSGWVAKGIIGFSWNAKQDPANGFPLPFTMVVRIDETTMTLVDEPRIWRRDRAFQYAAIVPNARGDLGAVALVGGGSHYQTCVALVRDADEPSDGSWEAETVDASDSDALRPVAGDYLGIVQSSPGANTWAASCMTLHGGGEESNVDIRFFTFGRAGDAN